MSFHDPKTAAAPTPVAAKAPAEAFPAYFTPESAPAPEVKAIPALEQMFGYYA